LLAGRLITFAEVPLVVDAAAAGAVLPWLDVNEDASRLCSSAEI
jgi:hypothetical protein